MGLFHGLTNRPAWWRRSMLVAGVAIAATATLSHAATFNVPPDAPPAALQPGQSLLLGPGGELPGNFNAQAGSSTRVDGGDFGDFGNMYGSLTMTSGSLGSFFDAETGANVFVSGGTINFGYDALAGSQTTVAGGQIALGFHAHPGSLVTLLGSDFALDGNAIPGLNFAWAEVDITAFAGQKLTGQFAAGGNIDLDLSPTAAAGSNARFQPGATLRLVHAVAGDFNRSGSVNQHDYATWKSQFGTTVEVPGTGGDGNYDGVVDAADYTVWRNHLGAGVRGALQFPSGTTAVPEPPTLALALLAVGVAWGARRRPFRRGF